MIKQTLRLLHQKQNYLASVSNDNTSNMDVTIINEYMSFIDHIIDQAGEVMKEGFYGEKKVEMKNGRFWDLVTDYDTKVESFLMNAIKEKYATHEIIAEEESAANGKKELTNAPTWLIDPIDGTYNYAHNLPLTCISVGLAIDSKVIMGIVYNPLTNSKYTAIKGQGAFLNGKPIHVSKQQGLDNCIASFEFSGIRFPINQERTIKRFLAVTNRTFVRGIGSAALSLSMVAGGGIDLLFLEGIQPWDLAAGCLIVQEAGGYTCHYDGSKYNTMSHNIIAASNEKIAQDLLDIYKENP